MKLLPLRYRPWFVALLFQVLAAGFSFPAGELLAANDDAGNAEDSSAEGAAIDSELADTRQHLLAGRDDAVLQKYEQNWYRLEFELPKLIALARKASDTDAEKRLTEFYLRHYPIVADSWAFKIYSQDEREHRAVFARDKTPFLDWPDIAIPFYRARADDSEASRQTNASLAMFEKFRDLCRERHPPRAKCQKMAEEFVEKFPQSDFCAAVVFNACRMHERYTRGGLEEADEETVVDDSDEVAKLKVCEDFAEHVRRADASPRCQLLVKALHASELANFYSFQSDDEQIQTQRRNSLAMFEEVTAQADRPHEKAAYLIQASRVAAFLSGPDALPTYRKILTKIMADLPEHGRRGEARLKLLQTYIDNEGLTKANDQVRAWDKAGEPDLDVELHTIAQARVDRKEFEIAQALCEEITARFPDGAATGAAWMVLAHMHEKAGREEEMIAAYKQAATAKPRDTYYALMDAGNTQSEAHEFLGEYYMKREDWKEALHWWESWEPSSWCGNCLASMSSHRKQQIEICEKNLTTAAK